MGATPTWTPHFHHLHSTIYESIRTNHDGNYDRPPEKQKQREVKAQTDI
jgi:hypothetical protein